MDLSMHRKDYLKKEIDTIVNTNPLVWFSEWFQDAIASKEPEPTAMVLSTASADNSPSSRVVLLKAFDESGFTFFTNYNSRKGKQISINNKVSIVFFWPNTERQVRIEGSAIRTSEMLSDDYFNTRPIESRLNAIISPQSEIITSKLTLIEQRQKLEELSDFSKLKRPANWGGYCVKPILIEFWQGGPSRLHDRIEFRKNNTKWQINRLAP